MAYTAIIKALKAVSSTPIDKSKIESYIEGLRCESDRGAVILICTLVEDALVQAIKSRTAHLTRREHDALFDLDGVAGTFSAQTKFAHALGMIDRAAMHQIDLLRSMRNACAHSRSNLGFAEVPLRDAAIAFLNVPENEALRDIPPVMLRDIFCLACALLSEGLAGQTDVAKMNSVMSLAKLMASRAPEWISELPASPR